MPSSEWPRVTIGSLIASGAIVAHKDGNYGSLYPRAEDFGTVGVPFLTAKSLDGGRIDIDGAPRLADDRADALRFGFVRPNDVLLSHNATIGRVAVVPKFDGRLLIGTSLTYFRLNPQNLLARYFAAYLAGEDFQNQLAAVMSHSTRNQVPISAQRTLSVVVPPLDVQHVIARVLGALDDRIEQNHRTGGALDGLARATFKAWFVDFEPVTAKAAGALSFPGMLPAAFAALPSRLTGSPLGPVPEGWAVRTLAEAFDINPPRRLSKGQEAPYLDMKNMPTKGHAPDTWERRPHGSGMRFINGDTLVARITPCLENGKTAYVDFLNDGEVGWGSTEYIVLRPKPPLPEVYAYCLARTAEFRDFAIQNMSGTSGRQRVAASALEHYHIAIPDPATAAAFGDVARPLFEYIRAGKAESSKLATLRDYLLPRLLSGTVRVKSKDAS